MEEMITNTFFAAMNIKLFEIDGVDCVDAIMTEHVSDPSRLDRFIKACLIDMNRPVETTLDFWNKRVEAPDWVWVDECEYDNADDNQLVLFCENNEWYAAYYSKWGFMTDSSDWNLD